jgi:hypothetical protein
MSLLLKKSTSVFIQDGENEKCELTYEIIQHQDAYSLLVIMTDSDGLNDSTFLYDITRDESAACKIVGILAANSVTPCTVNYVIEDLLSELSFHHTH